MSNIAILVDSGSDLPIELAARLGVKVLPLKVLYGTQEEYSDGVNIDPRMIYDRFPAEIPTTSTPNFAEITEAAEMLKAEGHTQLIAVCISSGLSGTYQNFCSALGEVEGMEVHVVDTKNISIGAGILAIYAAMLIRRGDDYATVCAKLDSAVKDSKVFYYMDTLDYLRAGGRIGRVTGVLGSILNIKPIISCNDEGVYHTVSMIRGQKRGMKKIFECVTDRIDEKRKAILAVMHGNAPETAKEVAAYLRERFPLTRIIMEKQINASLAVHTGPGLIGILVFQPEDLPAFDC